MKTSGDGNCAFNAFALGWYHHYKGQKECCYFPETFVEKAKECVLEWGSKEDVVRWLDTESDLKLVQTKLAPILRRLSVAFLRLYHSSSSLDESFRSILDATKVIATLGSEKAEKESAKKLYRIIRPLQGKK